MGKVTNATDIEKNILGVYADVQADVQGQGLFP